MSLPASNAEEGLLGEPRAVAERAAVPDKEMDDSSISPTLNAPPFPLPISLPLRLVGEYEVMERLGSGGMGEVYKARHRRLDKLVALKLLPASSQGSREMAARFQREIKAIGALDHPHVIEAFDAGEQSGVVYLAMKLIEGIDLEHLVKERGPLPIAEACELTRQAALGLDYLHQHGLVHRDIKPSNLMRTPDGKVKVLDLGLARWCLEAKATHALTETGRGMGTPDFLAPEQAENAAAADARADLYGLGGTLFYLLTGRAPFADAASLISKLDAHRFQPPPDVRTLRPEVPAELAALLQHLLAKKPEERFATAAEVAAALAPFADGARLEQLPAGDREPRPPQVPARDKTNRQRALKLAIGLATSKKSCTLTLAIGIAVLIGLPWLVLVRLDRRVVETDEMPLPVHKSEKLASGTPKKTSPPDEPLSPVHVVALDVTLSRKANNFATAGLLGDKVYHPHLGDTVTLDARLTRPAYAFLIAFWPDGQVNLCFPEAKNEPPPLTDNPRYPSAAKSVGKEYGLTNGVGLQAFAVVVSSKPLPAFAKWWPREGCPWKKANAPLGMIYRTNGKDPVYAWNAEGDRGPNEEVPGKTALGQLAAWLRQIPGIERVQVLGFVMGPEEKD